MTISLNSLVILNTSIRVDFPLVEIYISSFIPYLSLSLYKTLRKSLDHITTITTWRTLRYLEVYFNNSFFNFVKILSKLCQNF